MNLTVFKETWGSHRIPQLLNDFDDIQKVLMPKFEQNDKPPFLENQKKRNEKEVFNKGFINSLN